MAAQLRIGIIDSESTHVDKFVSEFNHHAHPSGARVTSFVSEHEPTAEPLAQSITRLATIDELLDSVDAVCLMQRDGGEHLAAAQAVMPAGLPVFIDKPLATNPDEARALLDLADHHGTPVFSSSAVRWTTEVQQAAEQNPRTLVLDGHADSASPHGGWWFYATHLTESACAIVGDEIVLSEVAARLTDEGCTIEARLNDCRVELRYHRERRPFELTCDDQASVTIELDDRYLLPLVDQVASFFSTGLSPLSTEQLLQPIDLAAALNSLDCAPLS